MGPSIETWAEDLDSQKRKMQCADVGTACPIELRMQKRLSKSYYKETVRCLLCTALVLS